ncbi:MAG: hypothetical protein A3F16_07375 [Deltaproteobacteria bacterium RIFCSPHIGHO2_12_FULL_43_9]|nr:MAG: hypothetical protein A3F16_07375 [Deltaproteobacteria bacterium RIFCSPHIGHO2_12_FULL_43_9]
MKRNIIFCLKLSLGLGVIFWLWRSGNLNPKLIASSIKQPLWFFSILFSLISIALGVWRWQILLKGVSVYVPWFKMLRLMFLGNLTTLVTPGVVAGDLLRGALIVKSSPNARYAAGLSVAVDRYIGLSSLFVISAVAYILRPAELVHDPLITSLGSIVISGALGLPVLLFIGLSQRLGKILEKYLPWFFGRGFGKSLLDGLHQYRKKRTTILRCYLLSLVLQFFANLMALPLILAMGKSVPITILFFFVTLGIFVLTMPVMPLGLGVGQVAFVALFQHGGFPGSIGAELCTLIQLTIFTCYLVGGLLSLWWPQQSRVEFNQGVV